MFRARPVVPRGDEGIAWVPVTVVIPLVRVVGEEVNIFRNEFFLEPMVQLLFDKEVIEVIDDPPRQCVAILAHLVPIRALALPPDPLALISLGSPGTAGQPARRPPSPARG